MPVDQVQANPAIRPKGPLDESKDKQVLIDLFAQGNGVRDAARKSGLSQNQVTRAKKIWGLTSGLSAEHPNQHPDRSGANEAFAAKARVDRIARYARAQSIADKLLARLDEGLDPNVQVRTILRGVQGIETEELVAEFPARDLRELVSAYGVVETQLQKIAALEDDQGLARGLSMLEKFTEAAAMIAGGTLPAPREGLIQE
ncbi:terminase small subunit [Microbacterium phage Johann]|uniref:Terminase small subunit n=2 Tax=Goodmanvirus goodman TaxID=2734238 RepID=A0A3G3LZS3_9CAUD|nr:terminase small subunit [Microbacterium phage Goodman]AYQ99457.1 terminase small subunit [Microbacterium phage Goodman]AYQ99625.1 terminase small subunit [Microbacterium phage Johann]